MTGTTLHDAQALAETACKNMSNADTCTRWLDMRVEAVMPGYVQLSIAVQPGFLSGHRTCHSGLVFTLANSASAFACNNHNHSTVVAGCSTGFLRPAHGGDTLTAEATEQVLSDHHGIYSVRATNQAGEVAVMFRGKSAQIRGRVIPVPGSPRPQFDVL